MAGETALVLTPAPGFFSQTGVAVTIGAGDTGNNNSIAVTSDSLLIAHNTNVAAQSLTITSVADPKFGRTGDVNVPILAADEIRIFRLTKIGWANASGLVIVTPSSTDIKFGVVTL